MLRSSNNRTGKPLFIIYPGEYYATNNDCYICTVVGACLAVCLYDRLSKIGGVVNFVVPGSSDTKDIHSNEISRIGILNMEYLIGDLVKIGGDRRRMSAKIFGAGYTENSIQGGISLPETNIQFVKNYFDLEKIEIEKSDLGGNLRRKIYLSPQSGTVYRKILKNNEEFSEYVALEQEYIQNEFRNKDRTGSIVLFD